MKKLSYIITIISSLFLLSCSTIKPTKQVDDNQKKIEKEEKKVENTIDELDKNTKQKKIQTATLAAGIQHSLSAVTNPPTEVKTAKDLNERVISIVGTPHIDELNKVKQMVDLLNSAVIEERKRGEKMLAEKDQIINKLQKETSELKEQYDSQMWDMTEKAEEIAKQADANKATLDSMSGMFGLNAVMWGLKKFIFSALTGIIIFGIIFLVLRVLAMVNPAAGAAFSIFNMIGSSILGMIKVLTPKAFELANFASKDTVDEYKSPLTKIVDVIQDLKEKQKDSPDRVYPLNEILKRFDKEMDSHEKDLIDDLLKELKWIK
jgi:peptidoglycan hydrolase CwlO-like protein